MGNQGKVGGGRAAGWAGTRGPGDRKIRKTQRAHGLGFFSSKTKLRARLRLQLQPLRSTLNLQWTRCRDQWAQPMPIKFTTTSSGRGGGRGGEKWRGERGLQLLPTHAHMTHAYWQIHVRTHMHTHTKRRRGRKAGARQPGNTVCKRFYRSILATAWTLRDAGSAARSERHDGGCGSQPVFWRGSCK